MSMVWAGSHHTVFRSLLPPHLSLLDSDSLKCPYYCPSPHLNFCLSHFFQHLRKCLAHSRCHHHHRLQQLEVRRGPQLGRKEADVQ